MHVQPEAATIRVADTPLWAPGAPDAIARFVAARDGNVRILEYGSGGSTMFLLGLGATVTTVEHHEGWAETLRAAADARGLGERLTILRRDRPYDEVIREFLPDTRFDILLVDGRERVNCLRKALHLVAADGLVLLDDCQRPRYWPAFVALADKESVTFESKARDTTIWSLGGESSGAAFVRKSFVPAKPSPAPKPASLLVPRALAEPGVALGYVRTTAIETRDPVEARLQQITLIGKEATFIAPRLYELADASVRIEGGRKLLSANGAVFRERLGDYTPAADVAPFTGAIDLPGRTLDLTAGGAGRYSFFLLDALPKLELLAATGASPNDFDTILVNSGASWVRDLLAWALGDVHPRIVAYDRDHPSFRLERSFHIEGLRHARFTPPWIHAYLERLFMADRPAPRPVEPALPDLPEPSGPRWLRPLLDRLRPGPAPVPVPVPAVAAPALDPDSFGRFVYISRQKAEGRRIVNHDAFLALIEPLGFREVFAEDHAPRDLAWRLGDVAVLISPHGAGLANSMFCPRSASVIELFSSHFTPQYFNLARDIGQDYRAFPCPDAHGLNVFDRYDAATKAKAEFNREDIVVPIEPLRAVLEQLSHA